MSRPPFLVTNTDRSGKVMKDRLYVRVGKRWRIFGQKEWEAGGMQWLSRQMNG